MHLLQALRKTSVFRASAFRRYLGAQSTCRLIFREAQREAQQVAGKVTADTWMRVASKKLPGLSFVGVADGELPKHVGASFEPLWNRITLKNSSAGKFTLNSMNDVIHETIHAAQHSAKSCFQKIKSILRIISLGISQSFHDRIFKSTASANAAYQKIYSVGLSTPFKNGKEFVDMVSQTYQGLSNKALKLLKRDFLDEVQAYRLGGELASKTGVTVDQPFLDVNKKLVDHFKSLLQLLRAEELRRVPGGRQFKLQAPFSLVFRKASN